MLAILLIASCNLAPSDRTEEVQDYSYGGGRPDPSSIPTAPETVEGPETPVSPEPTPVSRDQLVYDDLGYTGDAARAILRPGPYTEILVEIDHVEGWAPSREAREYLAAGLTRITGKKVRFAGSDVIESPGGTAGVEQIRRISEKRDFVSSPPRAALWIVYLDGDLRESPFTYGATVNATVAALFPEHFRIQFGADNPQAIENTVLLHEVGHMLGMTEYGYESPRDHHDSRHPGHNRNPRSVMHWKAEGAAITDLIYGNALYFDADDLADLAELRSGKL